MHVIFAAGDFNFVQEAPAKINLALQVTGQRADGYHLLDTLVTFARHGDRLGFRASHRDEFSLSGRFSPLLADEADAGDNLVLKARDLLRQAARTAGFEAPPVHIHLEKNLPVASGIGGGSADAAATLGGLMRLWGIAPSSDTMMAIALKLGADVPMCLVSRPLIARGIGETIELLPHFPSFAMVLGNPLVSVSTPEVFSLLARKDNPALALSLQMPNDHAQWIEAIKGLRNDLEPPARTLCNEIATLSQLIETQGAVATRMSGSGATCFGLFDHLEQAKAAAASLHSLRPDWYFQATETIKGDA
ncbi:4-(cytidine 5'-diphospho)-2-C-methyl-D-erythritol kinase [Rhizobium calliandrae]|uniref:4-diphosphocytidyl-2-C-methyl-D-erythritol kinase n=1 Tax=Rhizobium calliandrae TaxID=1312182 RepID=A0ABT7KM08_9HYPH|nr:4-(cytidine 5'-diphospho)-2-C-methyl-D-erythritol kinase [Rhizobium calliandrae]MDL2408308.1 4-(cytidine 5'-diphospho)-2-C-methyl-D-erythritol kinase [Rhizobium calliandrae]